MSGDSAAFNRSGLPVPRLGNRRNFERVAQLDLPGFYWSRSRRLQHFRHPWQVKSGRSMDRHEAVLEQWGALFFGVSAVMVRRDG